MGKRNKILYAGRATSLRSRVASYFNKDTLFLGGPIIARMVLESRDVKFIKTDSVLEAIILEANLIKKHQPPYNTKEKSDKSFNYIVVTKEDFPRVLVVRGKDIDFKNDTLFWAVSAGRCFERSVKNNTQNFSIQG